MRRVKDRIRRLAGSRNAKSGSVSSLPGIESDAAVDSPSTEDEKYAHRRDEYASESLPKNQAENHATPSIETEGLWDKAYAKLREDEPELIQAYETDILALHPSSNQTLANLSRQQQLQSLAQEKLAALHDARLRVTVGKKQIVVRDQVQRLFKVIMSTSDWIQIVLAAQPGAAAAWGGLFVVVPVSQNTYSTPPSYDEHLR